MEQIPIRSLNLSVSDSSYDKFLNELREELPSLRGEFAVFFEGNLLSLAIGNAEIRELLRKARWVFPDGIAVSKLASWESGHKVERISGPTFMLKACEYGQRFGWRHFFYGGTPDSLRALTAKLTSLYPEMIVAGTYAPPFRPLDEAEEAEVREQINSAPPHFLWVGLGGPKQEYWIVQHRQTLDVPFMLGVGAAFDFHSGTRPWAPKFFRVLGLEWLWRMFSGGRRTFFRNIRCVSVVAWFLFCRRLALVFSKKRE